MRLALMAVMLFLIVSITFAQNDVTTEGGNISETNMAAERGTYFWGGIVGWLNGSFADINYSVSFQDVPNATIYTNEPNGSYSTYIGFPMIVTRLPFKPYVGDISTPVPSDFNETGIFSNFTVFAGVNFSLSFDDPEDTFCSPCAYTSCVINGTAFMCPYLILKQNIVMAVLKFDNGTHVEPLFFTTIQSLPGYNGTSFDFEYMVPAAEDYYFYIYLPDVAPVVTLISPEPKTYGTTTIPLVYNITDDGTIDSCWYILDSTTVYLPSCGPSYVLTVAQGVHTLTLYANDTSGNIGSDSVTFRVSIAAPPPTAPPSAGPAGTPYYPTGPPPPPPPPPPVEVEFSVIPKEIYVTVDYPEEGRADFTLSSNVGFGNLSCIVTGDFGEYTTVELDSDSIEENGTVTGTIIVDMPPVDILDYDGETLGSLRCSGNIDGGEIPSAEAGVHLILNKPRIDVGNVTVEITPGEEKNFFIPITNVGDGEAAAVNISAGVEAYAFLFEVYDVPDRLDNGEQGYLNVRVSVPAEIEQGVHQVPIAVYENGRFVGRGYIVLRILGPAVPPLICITPDLIWTIIILLIGLILSIILFKKKSDEEEEKMTKKVTETYGKPLLYAFATMAVFFIIWVLVLLSLMTCEYVPADQVEQCASQNPIWTFIIPLIGIIAAIAAFKMKLNEVERKSLQKRPVKQRGWEIYNKPLLYAVGVFAVFVVIWIVIIISIPGCS